MKLFLVLALGFFSLNAVCQNITYSEPEREDSRRTQFEVIGKIDGNFLIFKNNRSDNVVCVYDNGMKELDRTDLDFMPERWINTDFVAYPNYCYLIYEYQK